MTHETCGTYAIGAECPVEGARHAIAQETQGVSEGCLGCLSMSEEHRHARRPGCLRPKDRAPDIRHPEAPGPDIPEVPRDGACGAPAARPGQMTRSVLPRTPGAIHGLFQRDLTSPRIATYLGGAR